MVEKRARKRSEPDPVAPADDEEQAFPRGGGDQHLTPLEKRQLTQQANEDAAADLKSGKKAKKAKAGGGKVRRPPPPPRAAAAATAAAQPPRRPPPAAARPGASPSPPPPRASAAAAARRPRAHVPAAVPAAVLRRWRDQGARPFPTGPARCREPTPHRPLRLAPPPPPFPRRRMRRTPSLRRASWRASRSALWSCSSTRCGGGGAGTPLGKAAGRGRRPLQEQAPRAAADRAPAAGSARSSSKQRNANGAPPTPLPPLAPRPPARLRRWPSA
jgi:hypothetical protein